MWTKRYWKATAERVVRGAAIAVATVLGLDGGGAIAQAAPRDLALAALYGALGSLVLSLIGGAFGSGDGPAITGQEQLERPLDA